MDLKTKNAIGTIIAKIIFTCLILFVSWGVVSFMAWDIYFLFQNTYCRFLFTIYGLFVMYYVARAKI